MLWTLLFGGGGSSSDRKQEKSNVPGVTGSLPWSTDGYGRAPPRPTQAMGAPGSAPLKVE